MTFGRWTVLLAAFSASVVRAEVIAPSEERLLRDITYLASPECEGRGPGTPGIDKAADYIAASFKASGFKGAMPDGSYFQPFTMRGTAKLTTDTAVTLKGPDGQDLVLKVGETFQPLGLSANGQASGGLVFVGYSAVAPKIEYDDYAGVDVAGKVVLMIRKTPRFSDKKRPFDDDRASEHAALVTKLKNAQDRKAVAVLMVNDQGEAKDSDDLMDFRATAGGGASSIPAFHIKRKQADAILEAAFKKSLADIESGIDEELKPRSATLTGWTATVKVGVERTTINTKNVAGILEGAGPLANETLVIGAHYDHLGFGGTRAGSLDPKSKAMHPGADDNGSGTTALLELARRLGGTKERQGRRIVCIAFSGEEAGLLGSAHYVKEPIIPLADTSAMINLDMVGRLVNDEATKKGVLTVYGTGTAKGFDELVEKLNAKYDFKLKKIPTGMGPSDQQSFYVKNVPVLFLFTGTHKDYHKPGDTADKINVPGMRKIVDMTEEIARSLADAPRAEYVKVSGGGGLFGGGSPGRSGPKLGFMPNYEDDGEGVLMGAITEGGAAEKAGLKEGDRIVEIGGKPVKNMTAYMSTMAGLKAGQAVDIAVMRAGKKLELKVTPQ